MTMPVEIDRIFCELTVTAALIWCAVMLFLTGAIEAWKRMR